MNRKTAPLILCLFASLPALADDTLPYFLGLGEEVFGWGLYWVLASECVYFLVRFRKTSVARNLLTVLAMNAVSTVIGFLFQSLEAPRVAIWLGQGFDGADYEGLIRHPGAQVAAVLIVFAIGYVTSTVFELLPMLASIGPSEEMSSRQILRHCALCNLVSYIGLTTFYLVLVGHRWGHAPAIIR